MNNELSNAKAFLNSYNIFDKELRNKTKKVVGKYKFMEVVRGSNYFTDKQISEECNRSRNYNRSDIFCGTNR